MLMFFLTVSWSLAESVLNALCCVSEEIKETEGNTKVVINNYLLNIFNGILNTNNLPEHPILIDTCCRLLRLYSFWLLTHVELIQATITYLMKVATISEEAGLAFKKICEISLNLLINSTQ
jgi:hypothetical protein